MNNLHHIKPTQINVPVAKDMMFYCLDSHNVNLTFAKREPHNKSRFLASAKHYRKQYQALYALVKSVN